MPFPPCLADAYTPGHFPVDSGMDPLIPTMAPTPVGMFLNIPLLARAHEAADPKLRWYYTVATRLNGGWFGIQLIDRTQGGASEGVALGSGYVGLPPTNETPVWGLTTNALPPPSFEGLTDFTNTFTFTPAPRTCGDLSVLQHLTYDQMMNGGQLFAVGAGTQWELILAADYVINVDGTVTIQGGLSRGYLSTERFTGTHAIGDFVFLLRNYTGAQGQYAVPPGVTLGVGREVVNDIYLDTLVGFAGWEMGVTPGEIGLSRFSSTTLIGAATRMPPPVNLEGEVVGGDTILTWQGRTRFPWMADDGTFEESDTPLFDITAYNGASPVESWVDITIETVTRAATDVTSFTVWPKNWVGRGFSASKTL